MTEKKAYPRYKNPSTGLTAQQEAFCQAYIACGKTYEAYIQAYPNSKDWKENSIYNASSKLLDIPEVQARLNTLLAEHNKKFKVSANKVLTEIVRMFETTNNEKERNIALKCLAMLADITGVRNTAININNIQINNSVSIDNYLKLD